MIEFLTNQYFLSGFVGGLTWCVIRDLFRCLWRRRRTTYFNTTTGKEP